MLGRRPGDVLWKFKIGDTFPADSPLSRSILRLLAVDEDLANIERLKDLLCRSKPDSNGDEISRIKWNRAQFLLLRVRLGFLHNALKDIIFKKPKRGPSFEKVISSSGDKVKAAHEELMATIKANPRAKNIIDNFRNQAAFHYGDAQFEKALRIAADKTGEIIINQQEQDVNFIVAYKVLDFVPAGEIASEEVPKLIEPIDSIQGKLHDLTIKLFDEYFVQRSLEQKITICTD